MPSEPSRLPLTERLRPRRLAEIVGNVPARAQLRAWAEAWDRGEPPVQRAALLAGPPGVGKTSAALALAADFGWSVVEMNASDARNERAIEQVAGRASITHSLLEVPGGGGRRRSLILLDEADSLSGRSGEPARAAPAPPSLREFLRGRYGTVDALNAAWGLAPDAKPAPLGSWDAVPRSPGNHAWARLPSARKDLDEWRSAAARPADTSDRGGLAAIARLVRATRQPLILTVNDERVLGRSSAVFRNSVVRIRFFPIRDAELAARLASIARSERLDLVPGAIDAIVRRARGDLRAALNDLEAIAPLPRGPLQESLLGTRDRSADFAALTEDVLTACRYFRSIEVQDRLDAPPDDLLPWIEENVPHFAADRAHRAAGFDRVERAERSLARARQHRVWGLWSYASELLTGGVGLAIRDAPTVPTVRAQFPRFLAAMGATRAVRAVREGVVRKAAAHLHLSRAKTRDAVLPFLEGLFEAAASRPARPERIEEARALARELELAPEELAYLGGTEVDGPFVRRLLADRGTEEAAPGRSTAASERASRSETTPRTEAAANAPDRTRKPAQRHLSDFGGR